MSAKSSSSRSRNRRKGGAAAARPTNATRREAGRVERAIAAIALRQHGALTRVQLLGIGLSSDAIAYRLEIGRLVRLHHGVYAVAYRPTSPLTHAMAAVLAAGDAAVLSHSSALTLWLGGKYWSKPLEVTAPTSRARPGLKIHRSHTLTKRDVTRHLGIPVTSPARTVLDNARRLPKRPLTRAVMDLRHSGYLRLSALEELLARHPRTPHAKRLRPFLAHPNRNPTRSPFEDDIVEFCELYDLPTPEFNFPFAGYEIDVFFPEHGVAVELDGWDFHSDRASFESDRERDADLLDRYGIVTIRITRDRFDADPAREAARLHRILRKRATARTTWR